MRKHSHDKITSIEKVEQVKQVEQQMSDFINLHDLPDGKYDLTDTGKVAVKVSDALNIFDVYTFVGTDGAKIKAGLLVKQVKLRKERREVTAGVVISGDVVSFKG